MPYKRFLITSLALAAIYFILLPCLWPTPDIAISVPGTDHDTNTVKATITIHSWHSNIALFTADGIFNVDKSQNKGNSIIATSLLPERDKQTWNAFHTLSINRWTWPRTYHFRLALPMNELRTKTDSNYVMGRIYVKVKYPNVSPFGFVTTSDTTLMQSVKIVLPE